MDNGEFKIIKFSSSPPNSSLLTPVSLIKLIIDNYQKNVN